LERFLSNPAVQVRDWNGALQIAQQAKNAYDIGTILMQVAIEQAKAADLLSALETLEHIGADARPELWLRGSPPPWPQLEARAAVAGIAAEKGDSTTADALVRTISDPMRRTEAVAGIAQAFVVGGRADRAVALLSSSSDIEALISGEPERAFALPVGVRALAHAGLFTKALTAVERMHSAGEKVEAILDIATCQLRYGDRQSAKESLALCNWGFQPSIFDIKMKWHGTFTGASGGSGR
jgi:hypothetical protein